MDRALSEAEEKRIYFYGKRHPKVPISEVAKRYQKIFKLRVITNTAISACIVQAMLKGWAGVKKPLHLYYTFTTNEVKVLLPKRHGNAFLKQPRVTADIQKSITAAENDPDRPLKGIKASSRPGQIIFQITAKISKSPKLRSRFGNAIIVPIRRKYGYCFEEEVDNTKFEKSLKATLKV